MRRIALASGVTVVCFAAISQWSPVSGGEQGATQANSAVTSDERLRHSTLSKKLRLLDRLVNDSPGADRIKNSDDVEAKQLLENAEQDRQKAVNSMRSGALDQSEHFVARGLAAVSNATRKVRDTGREQEVYRRQYAQLRKRVLSFSEAFQRIVQAKPDQPVAGLLDQDQIGRQLMDAERLASAGDYVAASRHLSHAADDVERALSRARDRETLLHELTFESPAEEYEHEEQRNDSYAKLIEIFSDRQQMNRERAQYVQSLVEENDKLRGKAGTLFQQGDIETAIRQLEKGTELLARALRACGVAF